MGDIFVNNLHLDCSRSFHKEKKQTFRLKLIAATVHISDLKNARHGAICFRIITNSTAWKLYRNENEKMVSLSNLEKRHKFANKINIYIGLETI